MDRFQIKAEHELTSDLVVSVAGIFRREKRIYETVIKRANGDQQNPFNDYRPINVVNQIDGSPFTIFGLRPEFRGAQSIISLTNPDFADEVFRSYNGVEIVAQKRFREGWQLLASLNCVFQPS